MKERIALKILQNWHSDNKEKALFGRYITAQKIAPLLDTLPSFCTISRIGFSVEKRAVHSIKLGTGATRVLMWSQMHGNESTTTKALFDLLKAFESRELSNDLSPLLEKLTICIIPILNPDGAHYYTRNNANDIDLNRDAQNQTQPESAILKNLFEDFKPDICFNLHGQRTIYGFENSGTPSVLSFLSPSADAGRSVTFSRKRSMSIITNIVKDLSALLPERIGRYDDGFNSNCVGDTFQEKGIPTVLFEAGHAPDDYDREKSRSYILLALISALQSIIEPGQNKVEDYFAIPEHQKCYCDVLIKNTLSGDIGILYHEVLKDEKVKFIPRFAAKEFTNSMFGHKVINAKGGEVKITFDKSDTKNIDIANISVDNGIAITL